MQCESCNEERLRHEFPDDPITPSCAHALLWCLNCVQAALKLDPYTCPLCFQNDGRYTERKHNLGRAIGSLECPIFKDFDAIKESQRKAASERIAPEGLVSVAKIDGQKKTIRVDRNNTIGELKIAVEREFGVPVRKQCLKHAGRELTPDSLRWQDAKVGYDCVLHLLVDMYRTDGASAGHAGPSVRALTFDLSWTGKRVVLRSGKETINHMNGSCFVMDAVGNHIASVDFLERNYASITHHGPSSKFAAKQKVSVTLERLPSHAVYLFFTLSGYGPGGIYLDRFQNPRVELRDALTNNLLAEYTSHANAYGQEAVILCAAKRDVVTGSWRVQEIGRTSGGCVQYQDELIDSIFSIVRQGVLG